MIFQKDIFLLLIGMLLLSNCNNTKQSSNEILKIDSVKNDNIHVSVIRIVDQKFNKEIISNGKIEAIQKTELRFRASERLSNIYVKNGDEIIKGKIIARIDNTLLVNKLKEAEINFDKAKVNLREEIINFGFETSNEIDLEPKVLKNLKIKSNYYDAENALKNAQIQVKQTILKAPFNGLIANLETKQGNYITPSDTFCTLINTKNLAVLFSILENDFDFIEKGQQVRVQTFSKAISAKGTITEINPLVDENGLIKLKAQIRGPRIKLFDGMNVKVFIETPIDSVIVVPKEAVVMRSNKKVIFTTVNNISKWNYVDVIDENSSSYAIKQGIIRVGDTVIVSGNSNLSHEAKVNTTFISEKIDN